METSARLDVAGDHRSTVDDLLVPAITPAAPPHTTAGRSPISQFEYHEPPEPLTDAVRDRTDPRVPDETATGAGLARVERRGGHDLLVAAVTPTAPRDPPIRFGLSPLDNCQPAVLLTDPINHLARHACLTLSSDASQTRGWAFVVDGNVSHLRPTARLDCSDGQVLHEWCLAGHGIAWRSTWEVEAEIAAGRLVEVLADFAAPPNGIYVVFPQRKHMPLRVRLWIEYLKQQYAQPAFWQGR